MREQEVTGNAIRSRGRRDKRHRGPSRGGALGGPVFYPGAAAAEVLRGWRDLTQTMPDQLTTLANILIAPPVPFLAGAVHGQLVVAILGVYAAGAICEDAGKVRLRVVLPTPPF